MTYPNADALAAALAGTSVGEGSALIGYVQSGSGVEPWNLESKVRERLSVFEFLADDAMRAAVSDGSIATDVVSYVDAAAAEAAASGRVLHFPAGTYPMKQWVVPANLQVSVEGPSTIFKQLDTAVGGVPTPMRFIVINVDGVSLWPGQTPTFDGGMTTSGVNATTFNSFVQVFAYANTTINRFEMGNAWAYNCGGDVFECGAEPAGRIVDVKVGMLFGSNIYQSGASVTSGEHGEIAGFIQIGGLGFYTINFEPNPTSPRVISWTVGRVFGNRISVVGDPSSRMGQIHIGQLHLKHDLPGSDPAFPHHTDQSKGRGMQYRWLDHLVVEQATFENYPYGALWDIGETGALWTNAVHIEQLKIVNCGATYGYEIVQQRTRKLSIGSILDENKPGAGIALYLSSMAGTLFQVSGGNIVGYVGIYANTVRLRDLAIDGNNGIVVRESAGHLFLENVTITNADLVFHNCANPPVAENCSLSGTAVLSGSTPNLGARNTTVNGDYYRDGFLTNAGTMPYPDAANDAAAAAAGVELWDEYRNGSDKMIRVT